MQDFTMVGGYTEDLKKPQYWEVGACVGVGTCLGQYGTYIVVWCMENDQGYMHGTG